MSGNFTCHNSKVVSVKKTKELSKKMGVTLNDFILGVISKILKDYFVAQGDSSNEITVTMPFSFKAIPESKDDYTYGNQFVSLTIFLKLVGNLEKACEMAKQMTKKLKNSTHSAAMKTLVEFYSYFMPAAWVEMVAKESGSKHSILLSNVPGY